MPKPVLFCYDGSDGSRTAMRAATELVAHPAEAVVLTVWVPASTQLALSGSFAMTVLSNEGELDSEEAVAAAAVAEEGAAGAREHGYDASPRVETGSEGVVHSILAVADELDARMIVCGQRGRGAVRSALLGSVSHALSGHARRPVLIVPEHPGT
jgi:nucleotide-binding universal stress UspA family protein